MKKTYINPECVAHKVDTILPIALSSNLHDKTPSNDNDDDNQFVKGDGAWDDQW